MSARPGAGLGAAVPGLVPARAATLTRLHRELAYARDAREDAYAARLEADIARLSAGSPANPARETLGGPPRPGRPAAGRHR